MDFVCIRIGDRSCDLVITLTLLKNKPRKIFKKSIGLDSNTWLRARAWSIWKAIFKLCKIDNKIIM